MGWQGNTIRKGAKRPENRVTRFPVEKVRRSRIGGGERSEPVSRIVILPYDTESQSRNVLASPLGEEGHEVAKGWTVVILIMILDVDVTAEGGIIKLIAP